MRRGHRVRSETGTPEEWELVSECEMFLLGGYAQYLDRRDGIVPAWAWLNALAHGGLDAVANLASSSPSWQGLLAVTATWQKALSYLAQEVRCVAEDAAALADLQASTLVPLELEWADGIGSEPTTPSDFVGAVMGALHQHQVQDHRRRR